LQQLSIVPKQSALASIEAMTKGRKRHEKGGFRCGERFARTVGRERGYLDAVAVLLA